MFSSLWSGEEKSSEKKVFQETDRAENDFVQNRRRRFVDFLFSPLFWLGVY